MSIIEQLPSEITAAYFPDGVRAVSTLGDGMINITLLVTQNDGTKVVIQRLADIFNETMIADYKVVSERLQKDGWEIPQIVPTADGRPFAKDNSGKVWRAISFIESDTRKVDMGSVETMAEFGTLLGKLHASLKKIEYTPVFSLPHFHDIAYTSETLSRKMVDIPSIKGKEFAHETLLAYNNLPALPDMGIQLIHADPRTGNILQRGGKPFTFIDWDTLMLGSIWLDTGDMLRSLGEDAVVEGKDVPMDVLLAVIEGYRQAAYSDHEAVGFARAALVSGQLIALNLTMRFLNDYEEGDDGYFLWDEKTYKSRHDHNMVRALNQWKIYEQIQKYLDKETK